ncbi:hypothetical protein [Thermomonospora cellulosilytica]|uniref:ABC-type branched-subunit amino acid transport system substrate-binding protein n=1 Tax=Thermomonospora cellulosilytica TaxID=1411118 RepID=A0A7W3MWZ6_9ACTN|nr:hypothetical protein [Thermomonospora cellulosilytica]MBA9003379.1 ABC-type branched-subunit amino acid transport system substrate-binding protein [Thermomonospora cellulosilytica]
MTQASQGAPPNLTHQHPQLTAVLRQLRRRPTARAGDRLRPLLLTVDSGTWLSVAQHLKEDCGNDGGVVAKVRDPGAGITDLLRKVVYRFTESTPRLEPPLRFQLLSMALWLNSLRVMRLAAEANNDQVPDGAGPEEDRELVTRLMGVSSSDPQAARRVLAAGIRSRRQRVLPDENGGGKPKLASVLSYLEQIAPIAVAVIALVSATAASALDLAAAAMTALAGVVVIVGQAGIITWDWASRRRYRWFPRQPYGPGTAPDFLTFAVKLINRNRLSDDELDKLLIAAFLEDLRQGYRRSWRRATWARVRYPTVILDPTVRDDPAEAERRMGLARRFVELVERVRADRLRRSHRSTGPLTAEELRERDRIGPEQAAARIAFDPLVIVACAGTDDEEVAAFADRLRPQATRHRPVDLDNALQSYIDHWDDRRRAIALGYNRDISVNLGRGDGQSAPTLPPRRRHWLVHPFTPWIVALLVLAASVTVVTVQSVRYCDPRTVWRAANGECVGLTDGSFYFDKRLESAERRIRAQNDAVETSGRRYVTIVYIGALTANPGAGSPQSALLSGVHGELVGLAIAQQLHNAANSEPLLRVLVANAGSRFRYADEVAKRIRDRALSDRTIVGVVGFGDSKLQTGGAIRRLSQAALPMVGTTSTYDRLGQQAQGFSPYYFRLAPTNRRLADHAAYWARSGRLSPDGTPAASADVFYDDARDDTYSTNLAEDFATAFRRGGGEVEMLRYRNPGEVPGLVLRACQDPADVFYYAGRSDEFRAFINQLANTSCGGRRIVLGGDEVTKYVSDNAEEIGRTPSIKLFYTPLAAQEAWNPRWVGSQPLHVFYPTFETVVRGLVRPNAPAVERPSLAHSAIAYDAAFTMIRVSQRVMAEQGGALPTAAAVLSELTEPGPGARMQGATGLIHFGPRDQGHLVPDKPVLLLEVLPTGERTAVAVCGRLVGDQAGNADCPGTRR